MNVLVWMIWLGGVLLLVVCALGYAVTIPMMRRRVPDPPDHPAMYGMPCDDVFFTSRDGLILNGWWIRAHGVARGTVIMCAGQNGSMDKDVPQAVPLHQAGFNVLMFDWRAHGRSQGERVTMGAFEQADLLGAVDYLAAERSIKRVGVLGFSMGAGVALMAAAQDQRIAALVVDGAFPRLVGILAGWGRLRGLPAPTARGLAWMTLLAGSLRIGYQLHRANPIDLADQVAVPVLFIHGECDPFVSTAELEALAARVAGPSDVWCVADAGHREAYPHHAEEYERRLIAWFEQYLAQ